MKIKNNKTRGYVLALTAAVCWGISGTFGQYLYHTKNISLEWLVTIRLLVSGVILLSVSSFNKATNIWQIWRNKTDGIQLLLFSIVGMLGVQYTYFIAIKFSNAATATTLQYLGPVIIASFFTIKKRRLPAINEVIAIVLAATGTFLLVTHGNPQTLAISPLALFWGISSAFAMAFYSIQPMPLLQRWNTITVIGWGMLVAAAGSSFINPPWQVAGNWDIISFIMVACIILFATVLAFYAYLISVKLIGATKASLIACAEPLSAAFLAVTWLKAPFGLYDWMGTGLIIATIVILTLKKV